ncbi:hypothetical protein I3760_04G132200 [Carya illinoinensis]|nr:hypothetical protein I3760_04G132200 [Carya illinoinensis]
MTPNPSPSYDSKCQKHKLHVQAHCLVRSTVFPATKVSNPPCLVHKPNLMQPEASFCHPNHSNPMRSATFLSLQSFKFKRKACIEIIMVTILPPREEERNWKTSCIKLLDVQN